LVGVDLDVQAFGHGMHALMGRAFAGNHADLAATIAVEDPAAEHLLDQGAVVLFKHLGRSDDGMRLIGVAAAPAEVAGEEDRGAGISKEHARPKAL
jgi:hypothetical protein